jgi:hypothetical protein
MSEPNPTMQLLICGVAAGFSELVMDWPVLPSVGHRDLWIGGSIVCLGDSNTMAGCQVVVWFGASSCVVLSELRL